MADMDDFGSQGGLSFTRLIARTLSVIGGIGIVVTLAWALVRVWNQGQAGGVSRHLLVTGQFESPLGLDDHMNAVTVEFDVRDAVFAPVLKSYVRDVGVRHARDRRVDHSPAQGRALGERPTDTGGNVILAVAEQLKDRRNRLAVEREPRCHHRQGTEFATGETPQQGAGAVEQEAA